MTRNGQNSRPAETDPYVYLCKSAEKEQEWTNIEISQTLMARKYWYRVKYNGEEVRSEKSFG